MPLVCQTSIVQVSHSPSLPTMLKTPEVASISPTPKSQAPPWLIQKTCQMRCSDCKGRWTWPWSGCSWLRPPWTPVEESWHWMLILPCTKMRPRLLRPSESKMCWKEAEIYCSAAIKEVEANCAIHACTLQQSHKESMLDLEHEVIAEEGWDHWAFVKACGAVLWACPPKAHGVLMYPLQLLNGNVPLASILGMLATNLQLATVGRELTSTASPPTVSEMPAPPTRTKRQQCWSDVEATTPRWEEEGAVGLDITPKGLPHWRWKEGRPLVRPHKESHWEAFGKDSDLVWVTRQVYFKMHHPNYVHEGSHDFSHTFKEMDTSAGLMGSDVHEVQKVWTGQKDL